jgi:L,D-peptidoglycan transpeptidase YkuD (ErfK/YbiS/YcfS/YnhG family)
MTRRMTKGTNPTTVLRIRRRSHQCRKYLRHFWKAENKQAFYFVTNQGQYAQKPQHMQKAEGNCALYVTWISSEIGSQGQFPVKSRKSCERYY